MKKFTELFSLFILVSSAVLMAQETPVTVVPASYDRALNNPMKGFTSGKENHPWASLDHIYIKWNELENDESDSFEKILLVSDSKFGAVAAKNKKVIVRVYLHWDGDKKFWPADMQTDDYTSEQFQERVLRLVKRLGGAWDNDPRVAFVELGIFGKWGEHHSPEPTVEMQKLVGEAFEKAFKNKKVSVRHMWSEFTDFQFGEYWDSWAHYDQMWGNGKQIESMNKKGRYLENYIGGEVAYNWGNSDIMPGPTPTISVSDPDRRYFIINTLRWLHCTHLRWISAYDLNNTEAKAGAEEMQKAFGYRYELEEVKFSLTDSLRVSFDVVNTGSAPFYYDWPVEVALLDPESLEPVWKSKFTNADIRTWLPGSGWTEPDWIPSDNWAKYYPSLDYSNDSTGWTTPPGVNTVEQAFNVELPENNYILTLSILDPAGDLPGIRFATANYLNGGRHPFGFVSFITNECSPLPESFQFDNPGLDQSLYYEEDFEIDYIPDPIQTPFKEAGWRFPTDSVMAWQYDYMFYDQGDNFFFLDTAHTIGLYGCNDTTGVNVRSYNDSLRSADAAQYMWDQDAETFMKNGQWLEYTGAFMNRNNYQILIRARAGSDVNFSLKIYTIPGDTIYSSDLNLADDFDNVGGGNSATEWYLSKFAIADLYGTHRIFFDWYDNVGDPGVFGGFSFLLSNIDVSPPGWIFASIGNIVKGSDISVITDENADIYMVPEGTSRDTSEIFNATAVSTSVIAYKQGKLATTDLDAGTYILYAIDDANNISEPTRSIILEEAPDNTPPGWVYTSSDTLLLGTDIVVITDEDGLVYLVPEGTNKDTSSIMESAAASIPVEANNEEIIVTSGLETGTYVLFAMDEMMNISDPSQSIILEERIVDNNTPEYANPGFNINYYSSRQLIEIRSREKLTEVKIFDMLGRNRKGIVGEGNEILVQTNGFTDGIYLVHVIDQDGNPFVKKVLICN